jgi:hypothetical protein
MKTWLGGLGIEADTAERYAQGLARSDIGYTTVSRLTDIDKDTLKDTGVNVAKHCNVILAAVQGISHLSLCKYISTHA